MQDLDHTRRTALKVLALLGVGATGSSGVAAADEHRDDAPRDDEHPAPSDLFVAHLEPQEDVETDAGGIAIVQERHDGLKFAVEVSNLENTIMGHIHEDEVLGPIAVWLYDFGTQDERLEEGRFSGILDVGTITDEVIAEGRVPEAESETVEELLGKIDAGEAYVNVHTQEHPGGAIAGPLVPFEPPSMMRPGDHDGGFESEPDTDEPTDDSDTDEPTNDSDTDTYG